MKLETKQTVSILSENVSFLAEKFKSCLKTFKSCLKSEKSVCSDVVQTFFSVFLWRERLRVESP